MDPCSMTGKLRHEGTADVNAALQQGVGGAGRAPRTHHTGRSVLPDPMRQEMTAKPTQELGQYQTFLPVPCFLVCTCVRLWIQLLRQTQPQ